MAKILNFIPKVELSEDILPDFSSQRGYVIPEILLELKFLNPVKKINPLDAWVDILLHVKNERSKIIINKKEIVLNPGEIIFNVKYFADRWQVSKASVSRFVSELNQRRLFSTSKIWKMLILQIPVNLYIINNNGSGLGIL